MSYFLIFSPNEDLQCKNKQTCKVQVVTFNQQNSCNPSFRFGMRSAALSRSKAELHLIGTAMAPASPSSYMQPGHSESHSSNLRGHRLHRSGTGL